MFYAKLESDGKALCHEEEEISLNDTVVYHSTKKTSVKRFCEKWNRPLKYYKYNEIKNITKGTNLIALLTIIKGDYIGLALQDKSYKIKIKNNNYIYSKYNFLVCYKVIGVNEEYLVPIGYSDEDEWIEQEEEYKQKLILDHNYKKPEEELILEICREMKNQNGDSCWNNIFEMINEKYEDLEDIKDSRIRNFMIYKVVKRCYQENFPIHEYRLFEIPYSDKNGWMIDFVHGKDYDDYHIHKLKDVKIREIDFWVLKKGEAIPQLYNPKTCKQSDATDCKSAVWNFD